MQIIKVRKTGNSLCLTIPANIKPAEYYAVDVTDSGHLIYKPVVEVE